MTDHINLADLHNHLETLADGFYRQAKAAVLAKQHAENQITGVLCLASEDFHGLARQADAFSSAGRLIPAEIADQMAGIELRLRRQPAIAERLLPADRRLAAATAAYHEADNKEQSVGIAQIHLYAIEALGDVVEHILIDDRVLSDPELLEPLLDTVLLHADGTMMPDELHWSGPGLTCEHWPALTAAATVGP